LTTLRLADGAYVCTLAGELDVYSSDALRDELEAIAERDVPHLIIDLIGVTFIDSAGLGLLLSTAERLKAEGGELVVVSDDPRALRLFAITGSDRMFRVERRLATAVDGLDRQLFA
jgi:anti-sigma B factor antagonist